MNRQTKATHFSLLVHALFLLAAFNLSQQAAPVRAPVGLDFSILPSSGPVAGPVQDAAPAAPPVERQVAPVEKKPVPKPVAKKTPPVVKKKTPPPAEKTPAADTVPVAADTPAPAAQDSAPAAASAPVSASPAQASGTGRPQGGNSGGIYSTGQLDGPLAVLAKSPPAYPPAAKRRNIEGWIRVKFVVDEKGQVGHVSVLAAEPEGVFEQSVLRCVSNWRFKPGTVKGMAVKALVEQTITFKLEG
ncbi:energy transducer TonB [Desulfobulbus elongatus]|uniref:energy transducer TonB n=1 Tax=Desulfobulbus elongatus TaxID=53332 RepID=UPI0004804FAF|nr:energy transducer TonB [Desulfobulbus elongatus]